MAPRNPAMDAASATTPIPETGVPSARCRGPVISPVDQSCRMLSGVVHFDVARSLTYPYTLNAVEVFEDRESLAANGPVDHARFGDRCLPSGPACTERTSPNAMTASTCWGGTANRIHRVDVTSSPEMSSPRRVDGSDNW
jgi:hypothetical protein